MGMKSLWSGVKRIPFHFFRESSISFSGSMGLALVDRGGSCSARGAFHPFGHEALHEVAQADDLNQVLHLLGVHSGP